MTTSNQPEQAALFSGLREGALVLADISGYSTFVAQTEVDHSWSILHELLDTMVRSLAGRMDVSQVEGDAILFISGLSTAEVVNALEGTFVAFHRRLRDMQAVTTCPCSACANIGILKLKFVIHHGKFSRQRLGSVEQLHGTDVIVAHRLLKNKVPSKEYLLVTDAVLERLPADMRSRFTPHTEEFDLGAISGGYKEIAYLWQAAQATERKRVLPEEAMVNSDVRVDAPRELVYKLMLIPAVMERYLFADGVDTVPGARGEDLGSEFHCHHGGSPCEHACRLPGTRTRADPHRGPADHDAHHDAAQRRWRRTDQSESIFSVGGARGSRGRAEPPSDDGGHGRGGRNSNQRGLRGEGRRG